MTAESLDEKEFRLHFPDGTPEPDRGDRVRGITSTMFERANYRGFNKKRRLWDK